LISHTNVSLQGMSYFIRFFITLVVSIIVVTGKAQQVEVIGRVLDASTGNPLEFAVVTFKDSLGALCGGGISAQDGSFQTEAQVSKVRTMHINLLGYHEYVQTLKLKKGIKNDVGNMKISPNSELLKEVEIQADRDPIKIGIDKRIYYPDQDLGAKGGTAIDALKSIPGISVGSDQSVQLRNQAPTIFVDGRPSMLTMDQIPSDEIDRIEVMTNPSAKYVADATGGILNIIMKKNLRPGYFGRVNTSLGSNSRYGLNSSFSIREKKFMMQVSGGLFNANNNNNGYSSREYLDSNQQSAFNFRLDNFNLSKKFNYNLNFQGDYQLNIRSALRFTYGFSPNNSEVNENQMFALYNNEGQYISSGFRNNQQINDWKTHSAHLSYRRDAPRPGKSLSADITFISSSNVNNFAFDGYSLFQGYIFPGEYQENSGSREADYGIFQLDYSSCDTLKIRLESGLRVAYKQSFSDFLVRITEPNSSQTLQDSSLSNAFRVDDFVGAAYCNVSGNHGKWGWQAGLRFEDTYFVARQLTTNETYSFIYPQKLADLDKALFPSVYVSRQLGKQTTLQLNYSRKIARPGYMQLIPFITYADRQLIQIGNPVLAPSFLNLAELNASIQTDVLSVFSGIYFRHEQGAITNVIFPSETDPTVLISTYANGTDQYSGGFEGNTRVRLNDRFTANLNSNVFYTDVSLQRDSLFINNQGWSWNARLMVQYSLSDQWKFQLNGNYEASRIIPQGLILPVKFLDFSISFKAGKKSNLNLTVSDLFNSKRFGTRFESDVLTQETYRRWETRYVRLSYTWQFGEPGKSLFKSRGGGRREPGNQGTEMQEL